MKKMLVLLTLLLCIGLLTSCKKDEVTEIELPLESILSQDDSYMWPSVPFGSSIQEVEKALDIEFPDIPYYCIEWVDGTLGIGKDNSVEDIHDYRNDNNYDTVLYTAYKDGKPVIITHDKFKGHLIFEFTHGELCQVHVYFGQKAAVRDENMNYGGVKNDIDAVFEKLLVDLESNIGPYTEERIPEYAEITEPYYRWESAVDIGEGFETRVVLYRERPDASGENDITTLMIYRNRYIDGEWSMN